MNYELFAMRRKTIDYKLTSQGPKDKGQWLSGATIYQLLTTNQKTMDNGLNAID